MIGLARRLIDMVVAAIGLVILSPVLVIVAVLVKRDSDGPALFRQERVGRHGKHFEVLKFRTMAVSGSETGPAVTAAGDPRVTRVGARLRSSKLDELPQLVNVVLGDMSLVGPRPEVQRYVDLWTPEQRKQILSVRPGITDPITVELRREEKLLAAAEEPEMFYRTVLLPEKAAAYARYVSQRSILGDLKVVAVTMFSIVRR
ncbi:MAG: sugar transferase [Actinobacteria bacterium]|nr:sugar transferase [Actinomycetota bacterium]